MRPAEQLKGMTLCDGWTVEEAAARKPNATGGHFSTGYLVRAKDGRRGFLKALDYTRAFDADDTAEVLQSMTRAYLFEKELCEKCAHLSKVARAIGSGAITPENAGKFGKVEYLIFELADQDIRSHLDAQDTLDLIFVLKTLHNVATGLSQLHQAQIAHQDLKPSNVLVYGGGGIAKICDLGRAWDRNVPSPHDSCAIAGDRGYAPIESLYGEIPVDQLTRRFGVDLYHLGSLIVFLFTRINANAWLIESLPPNHRPFVWGGTYAEILPTLQSAFSVLLEGVGGEMHESVRCHLLLAISKLCDPDPKRRGHPAQTGAGRFSLQQYVSLFDRLAYKAQIALYAANVHTC